MPKASVLEGWAAETPDDFRFVIKASRRITHFKRLKEVEEDVSFLLGQLEALGSRLGPVLYQLPPNAKANLDRLATFLELVPPGSSAFEFRNPSWHTDEVHALLRARDCALVLSETDDESPEIVSTAPWGYLRLRKTEYGEDELARWRKRLDEQTWDRVFVFFKHEGRRHRPAAGRRVRGGLRAPGPPSEIRPPRMRKTVTPCGKSCRETKSER